MSDPSLDLRATAESYHRPVIAFDSQCFIVPGNVSLPMLYYALTDVVFI